MTDGTYIPKTTENIDAAKDFLAYVASVEGTEVLSRGQSPAGPYLIKGASLPDDALPAILDIQAYLDAGNGRSSARVPVAHQGSRARADHCRGRLRPAQSAEDGAALYDQDVVKQAQQLGIDGWD